MPKERPTPPAFEPAALERSLNRYLAVGLVFMVVLIAGFAAYRVREPSLRKDAKASQQASYESIGGQLFETNCSGCHGKGGVGGSAPVLNSQEFLKSTTDLQVSNLIAGGVPGTEMPAWSLGVVGDADRRADPPAHDLPPVARGVRPQRPDVAPGQAVDPGRVISPGDGVVYVAERDRGVAAYRASNGTELWRYAGIADGADPIVANGHMLVGLRPSDVQGPTNLTMFALPS